MKRTYLLLVWILLFGLSLFPSQSVRAAGEARTVVVLTADQAVMPAMQEYINRGLREAYRLDAELVVIRLNTPGGSVSTMNRIVTAIRSSTVPVVVFVYPRGAMAASAGTILTLAGHAAAMAPETTIGAASPVGGQGEDIGETMEAKEKEVLKATVRSLAEGRGPEAVKLAEDTIQNAKAVSSTEAFEIGLVDFIATDLDDLLAQLDGYKLVSASGERVLSTRNIDVVEIPNTFIEQLLAILTDPNIVFLLLTIGVQAILIELSSPGGWAAGFIGVVCLALAFYGLGALPVNWFGILFLVIAFVLFIVDIKAPTHGALTAAGVGSFIVGALVLFNSPGVPEMQRVSVPLVIVTSLVTAAIFFTVLTFALRAQRIPVRTGQESLPGRSGIARSAIDPHGTVQVDGELWTAELDEGATPVPPGGSIDVVKVDGLRLIVRRKP
jgi:membrane-bound serine protease (ClpP class)